MAIGLVRAVFPDADVKYQRGSSYNGKPGGQLTVTANNGVVVASVTQREVSNEYSGPAIAQLKVRRRLPSAPTRRTQASPAGRSGCAGEARLVQGD